MYHCKDRWHNAWTHQEDALLQEAIEITGSRDRKLWIYLKSLGMQRTYKAITNRVRYLAAQEISNTPNIKGWGLYVR